MIRHLLFFTSLILLNGAVFGALSSEERSYSMRIVGEIGQRLDEAADVCRSELSLGADLSTCFDGFSGIARFADTRYYRFSSEEADHFLHCFDPYKQLLEDCTTFAGRDNDLALLDTFQVLFANDGEVLEVILNPPRQPDCEDAASELRFEQMLMNSFPEKLRRRHVTTLELIDNFCVIMSGYKKLSITLQTANPCQERHAIVDHLASILSEFENNADHKEVMERCFNR